MNSFERFWYQLVYNLPNFLFAILLLIIAVALGMLAKNLVIKASRKLKFAQKLDNNTSKDTNIMELFGNLALILVILLFLPSILERLGLNSITNPISGFLTSIISYLPRLIGAGLILAVGIFLSKIVKELLDALLKKSGIDNYQRKLGLKTTESTMNISTVLANVAYFLILIPIVIAALNTLNIAAISGPAVAILNSILGMLPKILGAIIVIVIGVLIAKVVAGLLYSLISGSGLNEKVAEVTEDNTAYKFDLAKIVSEIVRAVIIAIVTVEALNILNLAVLNRVGAAIVAFLPNVIVAAIAVIGAHFLGSIAKKFFRENLSNNRTAGIIAYWVIMSFAILYSLTTLGIGTQFIMPVFLAIVISTAVASALAFGLGGKEFAAKTLDRLDKTIEENKGTFKAASEKLAQKDEENLNNFRANRDKARSEYEARTKKFMEEFEAKRNYGNYNNNEEMINNYNEQTMSEAGIPETDPRP